MFQYFHCKLQVINDPAYLKSIKIFEALLYKENPSRYLLDICKIELKCKSQHLLNNDLKDDHTNFRSRKICLTFLIEKIGPDHSKQDFNARHQMVFIMLRYYLALSFGIYHISKTKQNDKMKIIHNNLSIIRKQQFLVSEMYFLTLNHNDYELYENLSNHLFPSMAYVLFWMIMF